MPKELILTGPRTFELKEMADRPVQADEVRLKTLLSGISHGTEMNFYLGTSPFFRKKFDMDLRLFVEDKEANESVYPLKIGYESVCRVVEAGAEMTELKVGDIVASHLPHAEAHFIDKNWVEKWVTILPPEVTPEDGILLALATVAFTAIHDAGIKLGDEVAVFGLGAIGLILVQMAKLEGAGRVIAIDPMGKRRALAQQFGADVVIDPSKVDDVALELKKNASCRKGVDVSLESSGNYKGLQQAIRSVRMAGRVVTLGYYQGGGKDLLLGEEWHHNRVELLSSMGVWDCPQRDYPLWNLKRIRDGILQLVARKRLDLRGLVTHKVPFFEAPKAYELIEQKPQDAIKIALAY
ncbi:MAG: zinc-binding dehydrogenase [Verrucomicrobiae bacterium]|nr:zinc-binding dehydrogenase [Verrucomicrobiae bacterium]